MHENETFLLDFFCNILEKIKYFNIGFVSLQYKSTNQYQLKLIENFARKSQIFERIFLELFWDFLLLFYFYM